MKMLWRLLTAQHIPLVLNCPLPRSLQSRPVYGAHAILLFPTPGPLIDITITPDKIYIWYHIPGLGVVTL